MKKFILPFTETTQGWYEIEAETLEEAREIVIEGSFTEDHDPFYSHKSRTDWDEDELMEDDGSND
jgi:hypothetical protein